jgi:hypothetical protein
MQKAHAIQPYSQNRNKLTLLLESQPGNYSDVTDTEHGTAAFGYESSEIFFQSFMIHKFKKIYWHYKKHGFKDFGKDLFLLTL